MKQEPTPCLRRATLVGAALALIAACSRNNRSDSDARAALAAFDSLQPPPTKLAIIYPADGTVFPPEIPAPTFDWAGPWSEHPFVWAIRIQLRDRSLVFSSSAQKWKPPESAWRDIRRSSVTAEATVTIVGFPPDAPESIACSATIRIRTSADGIGAPIMFRDVPLPFIYAVKNPDTIRWRLADVSSDRPPPVVLENLPVCGNCHSFDAAGRTLGMDVDYANDKGSYAITELSDKTVLSRDKIITWSDYKREDGEYTFGLLSQVSPDGRYVVSTVKDRSVFVPRPDLRYSQLFFPIRGILAVYDRKTRRFSSLPGADDPAFVQSNPAWSPDGKWVYFCREKAAAIPEDDEHRAVLITEHLARHFLKANTEFKYDIFRVPFNDGKGGDARAVPGASNNGKSNYFPRISPDGKWMVFCRAENFMLLQPDSRLYIMPAAGGEARPMKCNTGDMNSWHSWSPNGKWLVFSTKAHGPYTQLCLAHVDETGNDSPAVLLEHVALPNRACNIPEFLNRRPGAKLALREDFLDSLNFRRQGQVLLLAGDFRESVQLFRKALDLDPDNHEARLRLAVAYTQTDEQSKAETEFASLLKRLHGKDEHMDLLHDVHCHMALLCRKQYDPDQAVKHYRAALRCRPEDVNARLLLGLVLASQHSFREAEEVLSEAAKLAPANPLARMWLGMVLCDAGQADAGRAQLVKALSLSPMNRSDWQLIAQRILPRADLAPQLAAFVERYRARFPDDPQPHVLAAKLRLQSGNAGDAIEQLEKAFKKDSSLAWIPAKIQELRKSR